jgi:retron-type reverse transcriptase
VSEPKLKSFEISKMAVWEAYRRVKANKGGAGVDGESMAEFEVDLKANLYKLWNRLSSGSYFPPPVRAVQIPKRDGSSRTLGVPTVIAYHKVVQAAFGFTGRHSSVSSAAR